MHPTLELIKKELEQLAATVKSTITNNEPFNIAHGNWSFPGVTRDELAQAATSLVEMIESRGGDELKANEAILADYPRRILFLRSNTIAQIWGNPPVGVAAYQLTLDSLRKALEPTFGGSGVEAIEADKELKRLLKQLRAIEVRISDLDPRSEKLDEMVARIEQAHETADQLPTDMEMLKESREQLQDLLRGSTKDRAMVENILIEMRESREQLDKNAKEAAAIIERCDASYRATTSEGLASAFAERSKALNLSMWIWVGGLVIALILGAIIGSKQLQSLAEVIKGPHDGSVWVNLILSLLSIGAPIWFAWIATKQIGQRFRLAEDYGYKASISKAYEGYRREAALLDPAFQARLFSSALTRLDELPLRLVETDTHGSPWHELASSDLVRQAVGTVPGFVDNVTAMAKSAASALSKDKKSSAATPDEATTATRAVSPNET
ncbi:MAG: hypothetical protein ABFE02_13200 [Sulfuricella sp.]